VSASLLSTAARAVARRRESSSLRWAAAAYAGAQRDRVRYGEQLRALLQGRDAKWELAVDDDLDIPQLLKEIRANGGGPVPMLGSLYAHAFQRERELAAQMEALIEEHAVWPWLSEVKGIGATLAARLLSRLDIARAHSPASFWAYCGLATVPAVAFTCAVCGRREPGTPGMRWAAKHTNPLTSRTCAGAMLAAGAAEGARVAQPRPRRGERARYDMEAKKICYLIGVSFLRCGGSYRDHYHDRRAYFEQHHSDWPPKRMHLAAIRATAKRFLADLWAAWRDAEGMTNNIGGTHEGSDDPNLVMSYPIETNSASESLMPPRPRPARATGVRRSGPVLAGGTPGH
jgi:hypothetical protein